MSTIAVNAITDASGGSTASINGYTPTASNMAGRNRIINGDMRISQRGDYTSPVSASSNSYYLDRWVASVGTVSATVQQTSVAINGVSKTAQKIAATSSGTGYIGLSQRVELANLQDGETYTVSCWVRSNNVNTSFRTTLSGAYVDTPAFTNDGNWEKVSATVTLDKAALTYIDVGLNTYQDGAVTVTSGDYIEFTEFQLEAGSTATPFEHRQYGQELALAQRYYWQQTTAEQGGRYGAFAGAQGTASIQTMVSLPVTMRVDPTVTCSSFTQNKLGATPTALSGTTFNGNSLRLGLTVSGATANACGNVSFDVTISAEL